MNGLETPEVKKLESYTVNPTTAVVIDPKLHEFSQKSSVAPPETEDISH